MESSDKEYCPLRNWMKKKSVKKKTAMPMDNAAAFLGIVMFGVDRIRDIKAMTVIE